MAAQFIGNIVEVKLKPPRSWHIRATVLDIVDSRLELGNVTFVHNGSPLPDFAVQASQIDDVEIARKQSTVTPALQPFPSQQSQDPAILSYTRSPAPPAATNDAPSAPLSGHHPATQQHSSLSRSSQAVAGQFLPSLNGPDAEEEILTKGRGRQTRPADSAQGNGTSRSKQTQRGRGKNREPRELVGQSSPELAAAPLPSAKTVGWRQTPLLEEIPRSNNHNAHGQAHSTRQTTAGTPRKSKKQRAQEKEAKRNGWATEDATDVQDMPEFDFEANLSRFDKRAVFEELKEVDTTADEDRLVSFNRLDRKLKPSENVLDRRASNQDADSMDEDGDIDTGFQTSVRMVRNQSRQSLRGPQPLRRDSSIFADGRRSISQNKRLQIRTNVSPAFRGSEYSGESRRPVFRYDNSDKICPVALPEAVFNMEAFALADPLHLSTDVLTENAGRSIAELALSAINPGGRRLGAGNLNSRPVIVILASDNECGSRAIAAAVHLRERGVRCIASVVGHSAGQDLENIDPSMFLSSLGYQLRRFDGRVMPWKQTAAFLKTLDAPPELIIDGILDIHTRPTDLASKAPEDLKEIMEMMAWANKSRASCLAIDLPSGIDAITGRVEVYEGEPAEIRAKLVVACGIPTTGLLKALDIRRLEGLSDEWRVYVADIGLNPVLRRFNSDTISTSSAGGAQSKRTTKLSVAFGSSWIVPLQFDPGEPPVYHLAQ